MASSNTHKAKFYKAVGKTTNFNNEQQRLFLLVCSMIGFLAVPISYLSTYDLTFVQRVVVGFDIAVGSLWAVCWIMIPLLVGMESPLNLAGAYLLGGGFWILLVGLVMNDEYDVKPFIVLYVIAIVGLVLGFIATRAVFPA
jgi:hypothetical protein